MSRSGHFSVSAAIALVLGGIAALALATAVAWNRSGHVARTEASANPAPTASSAVSKVAASASPSTTGVAPEVEIELPLDTSDP
jgi:hypothetical protein